jgi:JAB domain-containing protein similar to deubiquitination enzymes
MPSRERFQAIIRAGLQNMDSEDEFKLLPPVLPYRPTCAQLRVPAGALAATLALLQRAGRNESGLLWYGPDNGSGCADVAYVAAPRQRMTWGNYAVSPQALGQIVARLADGWKPLAQIHSHPGMGVEHSNYDDKMISSRKILSLVFPRYGHFAGRFPSGVGVHEWQDGYWHMLDDTDATRRIVISAGEVKVEDWR